MGKKLRIELDSNDLGQAVDGLEVRAKEWEETAHYLRTGKSPDDFFIPEECRDAEEAESIARHYRTILKQIAEQIEGQDGFRGTERSLVSDLPKHQRAEPQCFTVICIWYPDVADCDSVEKVTVVISIDGDAQAAADNACLYLIRERAGKAEARLVICGRPELHTPHGGVFDAEEYDETITFEGEILSHQSNT